MHRLIFFVIACMSICGLFAFAAYSQFSSRPMLLGPVTAVTPPPPSGMPTPPTQAQVAGFTTCILCQDFTATTGGSWYNNVATGTASDTSTWLDCAGASNVLWYHLTNGATDGPCPDIRNEASINKNTLHFSMNGGSSPGGQGLNTYFFPSSIGITLPTNNYYETLMWVAPPWPSGGDNYATIWGGGGIGGIPSSITNYLEFDAFEQIPGPTGALSAIHNWNPSFCSPQCGGPANFVGSLPNYPPGSFDATSGYHRIGMRTTSDGTTLYKCIWVDGYFQNCVTITVGVDVNLQSFQLDDSHRSSYILQPSWGSPGGATSLESYVQYVNIFGCANWQSTACKTSNPDPGGY
jgi:hypothetical protein